MRHLIITAGIFLSSCAPSLSGKIFDGKELINSTDGRINVVSLDNDKKSYFIIQVQEDGSFSLDKNIEKGTYLIEALVPGYKILSKKIIIDKSKELRLHLKPLKAKKDLAISVNPEGDTGIGAGKATITPPNL